MKYETVQKLRDEAFKRSTGVQRQTFEQMVKVVEAGLHNFGRPPKLSRADQLLLSLMDGCEYRTAFHIGLAYGVSQAAVCRKIRKIEAVRIQSQQFDLPGKKRLQASETTFEIGIVDATEQPHPEGSRRPQKNNTRIIVAKSSVTPKSANHGRLEE